MTATSPMLERIDAKRARGEPLTSWEDGYVQGWTTCMANVMADQLDRALKGADE